MFYIRDMITGGSEPLYGVVDTEDGTIAYLTEGWLRDNGFWDSLLRVSVQSIEVCKEYEKTSMKLARSLYRKAVEGEYKNFFMENSIPSFDTILLSNSSWMQQCYPINILKVNDYSAMFEIVCLHIEYWDAKAGRPSVCILNIDRQGNIGCIIDSSFVYTIPSHYPCGKGYLYLTLCKNSGFSLVSGSIDEDDLYVSLVTHTGCTMLINMWDKERVLINGMF